MTAPLAAAQAPTDDPWLWLEDVEGQKALDWVEAHDAQTLKTLESEPGYQATYQRLLAQYDSNERIPGVTLGGNRLYNFWRDAAHPRGLWRRTTLTEYRKAAPDWETVLDLDALASAEGENWVWHGAQCLGPAAHRCLISLSRGGGDAVVVRQFDTQTLKFVDDGFTIPEAKSDVAWIDQDHLYVGSDFGPGSLTDSGYPNQVRRWTRGTPLASAELVFEGDQSDVASSAAVDREGDLVREFIVRAPSFFTSEVQLRVGDQWVHLDVPPSASPSTWHDQLLVQLRDDWQLDSAKYLAGSLLAMPLADFLAGKRNFSVLFQPDAHSSLESVAALKSALVLTTLHDVRSQLLVVRPGDAGWQTSLLPTPEFGSIGVQALDPGVSDLYLLTETDFLTPTTLLLGHLDGGRPEQLKQLPAFFDAQGLEISQHFATSKDGTQVPYFQVSRKDLKADGSHPTLLYGYGGFEISMTPGYSAGVGSAWLEKGGVYVLANIRGGGEYGPAWHQAALKENRQRAYDDFIAVAEDLIQRKVTSTPHLGIQGGSNGGLLMGVMLTERPDLFGAVVCQVPLLDMRRYNKLLAGASWMGEYGDPDDPAQWAYISKYSPYQNLRDGVKYPPVLFMTSTRDDRVHPGHARKMAAKMMTMGADVSYYENTEGGHGGAANNAQRARMSALAFTYLWSHLGPAGD